MIILFNTYPANKP